MRYNRPSQSVLSPPLNGRARLVTRRGHFFSYHSKHFHRIVLRDTIRQVANPRTTSAALLVVGVIVLLGLKTISTSDAVMLLGLVTAWIGFAAKDGGV